MSFVKWMVGRYGIWDMVVDFRRRTKWSLECEVWPSLYGVEPNTSKQQAPACLNRNLFLVFKVA